MNIRKLSKEQIKALINKPNFLQIYETLDKESKRILKPYMKHRKGPSIIKRASNLTMATAKWQKANRPQVAQKTYEERLSICKKCEFWKNKSNIPRAVGECTVCGCVSFKLLWATESCPLPTPKWKQVIPTP